MKKKSLSILIALALTTSTAFVAAPKVFADTTNVAPVTATTPASAAPQVASNVGVTAQGQVQNIGWQSWVNDGTDIGTVGQSLRLETLRMKLTGNNLPAGAGIQYQVQVQNVGWMNPVNDGADAGTVGQSLRLETARIKLVNMPGYTVQYRAQVEDIGWMPWVSDGADAGTVGQSLRMETLQVRVVKTDAEKIAEATAETAVAKAEASKDQADVAAAKAAVANVQDTTEVAAFNYRINAIAVKFEVASVSASDAMTLQVQFSKAANAVSSTNAASITNTANYTLNGGALPAGSTVTASADGTTATISLPYASKLTNNTSYIVGVKKAVSDASGNAMANDYSQAYTFTDTTAPTLGAVSYTNNNTAKVSFSEPMNAITTAQVKVFDADGNDVTAATLGLKAATTNGDKDLTIDLTAIPNTALNKAYTVYVYGAQDVSGNFAGTKSFTVTKTNADTTAPTVTSVKATALDTFVVTFSEPVVDLGATSYATYKVDGAAVTPTSQTLSTDGTQATVKLTAAQTAGLHSVEVNGETDPSGNAQTTAYDKVIDFEADTTAPKVVSTSITNIAGVDNLLVKFDDPDIQLVTPAPANALTNVNYVANSIELTQVPFGTAVTYDPQGLGKTDTIAIPLTGINAGDYTATLASVVKDSAGNAMAATPITFSYAPTASTTKPAVVDGDSNVANGASGIVQTVGDPSTVTVSFNKPVTVATALNVNNYTVDGQCIFSKAIFSGDNKTVKLTVNKNAINVTAPRQFSVSNVADTDGNVMDPITFNQSLTENVAPTVKSATLTGGKTISVTFSKAVSAALDTDFDVSVGGTKVTHTTTPAVLSVDGKTLTITLDTALTPTDLSKGVTVAPSAANTVKDADGNPITVSTVNVAY